MFITCPFFARNGWLNGNYKLERNRAAGHPRGMSESPLPAYSKKVFWKDYCISTPTFSLTPVEKPDMSPYLVHMTGKDQIAAILRGEGNEAGPKANTGFLISAIPSQSKGNYFAKVVCFTESPSFAIDFFRYRVFKRWRADILYGIGFAKDTLVSKGVLPALYLSAASTQKIVSLHKKLEQKKEEFAVGELSADLRDFFQAVYPLCTPLLEAERDQGYSWEREWRYPAERGFVFELTDVRVICCPDEERGEISKLLGAHSENVTFVRSWVEFSDVRDYLGRQAKIWAEVPQEQERQKLLASLDALLQMKRIAFHTLEGYLEKLLRAKGELEMGAGLMPTLKAEIASLEKGIEELKSPAKK